MPNQQIVVKHTPKHNLDNNRDNLLNKLLANRNITTESDITKSLADLIPITHLKDITKAAKLISGYIIQNKNICFVGDFDSDGATSTAVMLLGFKKMRAKNIDFIIPSRFHDGYGLSPKIVDIAKQKGVDLIITLDNGISSIDGANRAKELNIEVIVTDHHLAGDKLPDVYAIVNPNQPNCDFASKNIAGVGVAFYVLMATRIALREQKWFDDAKEPNLAILLDLVAIGTVADLVEIDKNNRILVQYGLKILASGQSSFGLQALMQVNNVNPNNITTSDIGFKIAPNINAAGRLKEMQIGVNCLIADNLPTAISLAKQLAETNQDRKNIQKDMFKSAKELSKNIKITNESCGICLYDEHWHEGLVGLIAGQIKDNYYRPCIAFAQSQNKNELKGSARSIAGLNIRDLLADINNNFTGIIIKFGGHAMAAGLSIYKDKLTDFKLAFDKQIKISLSKNILVSHIYSDGNFPASNYDSQYIKKMLQFMPWGKGIEEPIFTDKFTVKSCDILQQKHIRCKLKPDLETNQNILLTALFFNAPEDVLQSITAGDFLEITYGFMMSEFNNNLQTDIKIIQIKQP